MRWSWVISGVQVTVDTGGLQQCPDPESSTGSLLTSQGPLMCFSRPCLLWCLSRAKGAQRLQRVSEVAVALAMVPGRSQPGHETPKHCLGNDRFGEWQSDIASLCCGNIHWPLWRALCFCF